MLLVVGGGGYRLFKALITLWTPSLLPQIMLLLHFLKTQFTPKDGLHVPGVLLGLGKTKRKGVPLEHL